MPQGQFERPLFIKEGKSQSINLLETPYFCNTGGSPQFTHDLPAGATEVLPACNESQHCVGKPYAVHTVAAHTQDIQYGEDTQLILKADVVEYKPLWATRENAAAFGLTLIEQGQAIRLDPYSDMVHTEFEYGMFAGHFFPYEACDRENRPLGIVGTDLECHNFPHIFTSSDLNLPLVISVARYWQQLNIICFADLWLPRSSALYAPACGDPKSRQFLDLHGNRNSALACWRAAGQTSVSTHTLLRGKESYFHWFWSRLPTIHPPLMDPNDGYSFATTAHI